MKNVILISGLFLLTAFQQHTTADREPVAVVELFTSEGCSSCPAAEDMFKEMIELTAKEGKHVIGLAFHVTYWNRLGWKDPYSREEFTERQKQYKDKFGLSSVYTPQMVFNGEEEFVGSNPIAFRNAVESAWSRNAKFEITAHGSLQDNNKVRVTYTLNRKAGKEILNAAWIEHEVTNHIAAGENKGRTLKHMNIVRTIKQTALQDEGEVELTLPEHTDPAKGSVVLYIQHQSSLEVLGAAEVTI